jgi:hypothetical protein
VPLLAGEAVVPGSLGGSDPGTTVVLAALGLAGGRRASSEGSESTAGLDVEIRRPFSSTTTTTTCGGVVVATAEAGGAVIGDADGVGETGWSGGRRTGSDAAACSAMP